MRVAVGADHGGFCQKDELITFITSLGYEVKDCGPESDERCDYPDFAQKVAELVASGECERGILICGTGIGMSIAANKVDGIRAANVTTPEFARLSRQHNNANIECLSGRFVDIDTNKEIVKIFLTEPFEGGRHMCRVQKIMDLQN